MLSPAEIVPIVRRAAYITAVRGPSWRASLVRAFEEASDTRETDAYYWAADFIRRHFPEIDHTLPIRAGRSYFHPKEIKELFGMALLFTADIMETNYVIRSEGQMADAARGPGSGASPVL